VTVSVETLEPLEQLYTGFEVCDALQMDPQTLRRKARAGEIDSMKVGREYRYTRAGINKYLAKSSMPSPAPIASKPARNPRRRYKN
jgi:excisionase family DNA binding protein